MKISFWGTVIISLGLVRCLLSTSFTFFKEIIPRGYPLRDKCLLRSSSTLQNGPRHTTLMATICAILINVSSLFTNVPLDKTMQICLDKLFALANPPKLPRSVLKDLLVLPLKGAILCLMASTTTISMVLPWDPF